MTECDIVKNDMRDNRDVVSRLDAKIKARKEKDKSLKDLLPEYAEDDNILVVDEKLPIYAPLSDSLIMEKDVSCYNLTTREYNPVHMCKKYPVLYFAIKSERYGIMHDLQSRKPGQYQLLTWLDEKMKYVVMIKEARRNKFRDNGLISGDVISGMYRIHKEGKSVTKLENPFPEVSSEHPIIIKNSGIYYTKSGKVTKFRDSSCMAITVKKAKSCA